MHTGWSQPRPRRPPRAGETAPAQETLRQQQAAARRLGFAARRGHAPRVQDVAMLMQPEKQYNQDWYTRSWHEEYNQSEYNHSEYNQKKSEYKQSESQGREGWTPAGPGDEKELFGILDGVQGQLASLTAAVCRLEAAVAVPPS
eukprot:3795818-Pyramimonas_sp.AAC.1